MIRLISAARSSRFGALDAQTREIMQRRIAANLAGNAKTVLLVTHDVTERPFTSQSDLRDVGAARADHREFARCPRPRAPRVKSSSSPLPLTTLATRSGCRCAAEALARRTAECPKRRRGTFALRSAWLTGRAVLLVLFGAVWQVLCSSGRRSTASSCQARSSVAASVLPTFLPAETCAENLSSRSFAPALVSLSGPDAMSGSA